MKRFTMVLILVLTLSIIFGLDQTVFAQCGSDIPAPDLTLPEDGLEDLELAPTLAITINTDPQADEGACTPFRTWFQVSADPEFQQDRMAFATVLSAEAQDDLNAARIPEGALNTNTRYYWRAATSFMVDGIEVAGQFAQAFSFITQPCNLNRLTNFAPENGARILEAPTLSWEITGFGAQPRCDTHMAEWQIATDAEFSIDSLVFSQLGEGLDRLRYHVPDNVLVPNTEYYWRVRNFGVGQEAGAWTNPTRFTIVSSVDAQLCEWPLVSNASPSSNASGVSTTPLLELTLGPEPANVCEHNATQWQILPVSEEGQSGFTVISDAGLLSFNDVPEDVLQPGTAYRWRARLYRNAGEPSPWSAFTTFTTGALVELVETCLWPPIEHVAPADGAVNVVLNPTLIMNLADAAGVPQNCQLDHVRWQVGAHPGFATHNVVFDSGERTGRNLRIQIPTERLVQGTTYYWRVRPISEAGITSEAAWSTPTSFMTSGVQGPIDAPLPDPGEPDPSPDGPGDLSVACAVDVNNNGLIDDAEILESIRLWVTGEAVPNTDNNIIDDVIILDMIRHWVLTQPLDCEGVNPPDVGPENLPDLVFRVIDTPSCLLLGAFLNPPSLEIFVRNVGNGISSGFMSGIYLSDDETINRQDRVLIGGRDSLDGLIPGGAAPLFIDVGILEAEDMEPGDYFLGMLLDEGEEVVESDETNNSFATPVRVVDSPENC